APSSEAPSTSHPAEPPTVPPAPAQSSPQPPLAEPPTADFAERSRSVAADDPRTVQYAPGGEGADGGHPTLIGRYAVERVLGEGAFGTVYLARDGELKREVAI